MANNGRNSKTEHYKKRGNYTEEQREKEQGRAREKRLNYSAEQREKQNYRVEHEFKSSLHALKNRRCHILCLP